MTDTPDVHQRALPPRLDSAEALRLFRARMTRGLLQPGDLSADGEWEDPQLLYVPIRRVRLAIAANWSAESGNLGPNRKMLWSPVTGTRHGIHDGILIPAADGPWRKAVDAAIQCLEPASPSSNEELALDGLDGEVVPAQMSLPDTEQAALARMAELERKSCLDMVPGAQNRNLKVDYHVEQFEAEELFVPIYSLDVTYKGTTYTGFVDGLRGNVYSRPPTSLRRILLLAASVILLVLGILAYLPLSTIKTAPEPGARQQAAAAAKARALETLHAELAKRQPDFEASLQNAADKLHSRDASQARLILTPIAKDLKHYRQELGPEAVAVIWDRYSQLDADLVHLETVQRGMTAAKRVVGSKSSCNTPLQIANAWKDLQKVKHDDPEWKQASILASRLERCRTRAERDLTNGLKQVMIAQRTATAERMERLFLDRGLDVHVALRGRSKSTIELRYVLMSRPLVHQLTESGSLRDGAFLRNLQDIGFRKVIFSDGYDESWSYTLEPDDEDHGGKAVLTKMGIGEPLRLAR